MSNTVLVSFLYPNALKYFSEFIYSIQQQTTKDFDIIIFCDAVKIDNLNTSNLTINFIELTGTPFEIRELGIDYLANSSYENFIFLDSDDTMSSNRIEISHNILKSTDIVCCDLNLMDDLGNIWKKNIWSKKLSNNKIFDSNFLIDKNIVGLGNISCNKIFLLQKCIFSENIVALDWFIFYQKIKNGNFKVTFNNKMQVNYRQHIENTAGIKKRTKKEVTHILKSKNAHYESLLDLGYSELAPQYLENNKVNIIDKLTVKSNHHLFWWEL